MSKNKHHISLQKFSFRFAEQVMNSNLAIKQEIEDILLNSTIDIQSLSRPQFNSVLKELFLAKDWEDQPALFDDPEDPGAKMDFLKSRIGVEVGFSHASFIGIDLLKFQTASYSALNKIDLGIYIVTTKNFQNTMKKQYNQNWEGSLSFEKVVHYLPHFKSAIQVPILTYGIDI